MKLLPVPGAPGYRVDCENQQAYSMKRGILRPINFRTKYKKAVLTIDRQSYGAIKHIGSVVTNDDFCVWHFYQKLGLTKLK